MASVLPHIRRLRNRFYVAGSGATTGALLTPCIYDQAAQVSLIQDLLNFVIDLYETEPEKEEEPEHIKRVVGLGAQFLSGLVLLAAVFKHPGFQEEREWRLIRRARHPGESPAGFREGRGEIVPHIPLPVRLEGRPLRIDEVIVGPNPHLDLAKEAVEALFKAKGIENDGIRASSVPYRSW